MDNVMQFEESRGTTPGHTASTTVAMPDQAHDARWHVLVGALGDVAVHRSDVLGIAQRALDRIGADGNAGTSTVLPALAASLANCHGDLESCAACRLGRGAAVEDRAAQCRHGLVIVEVTAVLVVE